MAKVKKVIGTPKADIITVKATSATVNKKKLSVYTIGVTVGALGGDDVIKIIRGSKRTVLGGSGNDKITVSSGNSHKKIDGGTGNDTITVNSGKNHKIYGGTGNDTITIGKSAGSDIAVSGGDGDDTIKILNKHKVTVNGGSGNDTITGGTGSDVLKGGSGNDTLYGGKNDDTLTGGKGMDTFVYANGDGKDTITDYSAADNDTLYISSGSISDAALVNSSKDLRFYVGSGTVTLKNAASKTISLKDKRGTYTASKTEIALGSDVTGTMDTNAYLITVTDVDGFAAKNEVIIIGNSNANTLIGGKGDDYLYGSVGDDTLDGGMGNDTLTGGAGNDTFLYTEGNDTIKDYTQGEDKLEIEDYVRISNVAVNGGDVNLAVSLAKDYSSNPTVTGNINLQNVSGKEIQVTEKYQGTYTLTAGNKTTATLDQDYTGTIFLAANGIDEIDARATTANLTVMGNAKDNVIYAGESRSMMYGLAGSDTFYFDNTCSGTDTICDFASNEIIKFASPEMYQIIEGTVARYELDGNNVLLQYASNQGGGTISLLKAKDKTATIAYGDTGSTSSVTFS